MMLRGITDRVFRMTSNATGLLALSPTNHLFGSLPVVSHLKVPVTEGSSHLLQTTPFLQQVRTTYILKRRNTLYAEDGVDRRMQNRYFIYELVENKIVVKKEPIKLLILKTSEEIGLAGEVKEFPVGKARKYLLIHAAVYASPENVKKYSYLRDKSAMDQPSSQSALKTAKAISLRVVDLDMNMTEPWQIEPWHIRVNMRRIGIRVPDECITLPKNPIVGPNLELEGKEFLVTVKINNKEEAPVRCRIYHVSPNPKEALPIKPNRWIYPAEPIFPEEAEILAALTSNDLYAQKMLLEEQENE